MLWAVQRGKQGILSLSSSGGEGWGEEAFFVHSLAGSWGASTFCDAHCDREPCPLHLDSRRELPLPEGEGWGEGEQSSGSTIGVQNGSWGGGKAPRLQ